MWGRVGPEVAVFHRIHTSKAGQTFSSFWVRENWFQSLMGVEDTCDYSSFDWDIALLPEAPLCAARGRSMRLWTCHAIKLSDFRCAINLIQRYSLVDKSKSCIENWVESWVYSMRTRISCISNYIQFATLLIDAWNRGRKVVNRGNIVGTVDCTAAKCKDLGYIM
jgi:hypothetical protein